MRLMCRSGTFHFPSLIPVLALTVSATLCSCEGFLFHGCEEVTAIPLAEVRIEAGFGGEARDIQPTADGGYIIAGRVENAPFEEPFDGYFEAVDAYLAKTDATGVVQWAHAFDVDGYEVAESVQPVGDGGYIVTGSSLPADSEDARMFVIKADADGNAVWSRYPEGVGFTTGNAVCVNADGSLAVAGETGGADPNSSDALLIKFDADGNELWRRTFQSGNATGARDVIATYDGGYAFTGYRDRSDEETPHVTSSGVYVVKTDSEGRPHWEYIFDAQGNSSSQTGRSLVQTRDGGFALVATTNADLYVAKLEADGTLEWERHVPGSPQADAFDLVEASDGSLVVAGVSYLVPLVGASRCNDVLALRVSEGGDVLWSERYGNGELEGAFAIAESPDGNFVLAGTDGNRIYLVTTAAR